MYILYSAALAITLLLASPWMLSAAKRRAGLREKLGFVPARLRVCAAGERCIWVHAVSVGEVLAASRLISLLREHGGYRIVVSTTTATGQKLARERFGEANVFYFPWDFAFAIRRYLRALCPELVVLVESEFWPNFLRLVRRSGARVVVVNARISDRSLPRYLALKFAWRRILRDVDLFLARSLEDEQRLVAIGAARDRIRLAGNLKFDVTAPPAVSVVEDLRRQSRAAAQVIVCGSTADGEDTLVLDAFRRVLQDHPTSLLVLAPRHPERFAAVAELIKSSGFILWRRSQLASGEAPAGGVLLLDSVGELAAVYGLASIAVVGGSFVPRGGHNILEPAQHGVPVVTGPYTENFRDIVELFRRQHAVRIVAADQLGAELLRLLSDPAEREALGRRAAEVFRSEAGATRRCLDALQQLLATPVRDSHFGAVEVAK